LYIKAEMILVILYMIIGVAFYSGTIGYLGSIFQNMDRKVNTLKLKLEVMDEFCKENNI
jgi:hypothetical protein